MAKPKQPLFVEVDGVAFVRALKALNAAEPVEWRRATISSDGEALVFAFGEVAVKVPAHGTWIGEVRMTGRQLRNMNVYYAEMGSPTIPIRVENGRLYIGEVSGPCTWRGGERNKSVPQRIP